MVCLLFTLFLAVPDGRCSGRGLFEKDGGCFLRERVQWEHRQINKGAPRVIAQSLLRSRIPTPKTISPQVGSLGDDFINSIKTFAIIAPVEPLSESNDQEDFA